MFLLKETIMNNYPTVNNSYTYFYVTASGNGLIFKLFEYSFQIPVYVYLEYLTENLIIFCLIYFNF
jgi:hypothetical protein